MHILVDITHPAHVHFFRNAIAVWRAHGHQVSIAARRKDIALELMDRYGWEYTDLGQAKTGFFGLLGELVSRNLKLSKLVGKLKPDVMVAIGGIFIAHVGFLRSIPALVFTDTENATLSNRLTFPVADKVITPDCYEAPVPKSKHVTYPGYHELAYVHPKRFTPDPSVLEQFGLTADEPYIVLRVVAWGASHDFHDHGFSSVEEVVGALERYGRVLISSEKPLPASVESKRVKAAPELMHQLLYHARLFIGESATMASESACMGTPAIFISTSVRGYTNEQERKYDLTYTFSDPAQGQRQALEKALAILADPQSKAKWQEKRERLLTDKIDVTAFIVDYVENHGAKQRRS